MTPQAIVRAIDDLVAAVDDRSESPGHRFSAIIAARQALLDAVKADSVRLDWMQEHGASVSVVDDECLPCEVQASDDYRLHGGVNCYDIRAAIDAAMSKAGGGDSEAGSTAMQRDKTALSSAAPEVDKSAPAIAATVPPNTSKEGIHHIASVLNPGISDEQVPAPSQPAAAPERFGFPMSSDELYSVAGSLQQHNRYDLAAKVIEVCNWLHTASESAGGGASDDEISLTGLASDARVPITVPPSPASPAREEVEKAIDEIIRTYREREAVIIRSAYEEAEGCYLGARAALLAMFDRARVDAENWKAVVKEICDEWSEANGATCDAKCDSFGHTTTCKATEIAAYLADLRSQLATATREKEAADKGWLEASAALDVYEVVKQYWNEDKAELAALRARLAGGVEGVVIGLDAGDRTFVQFNAPPLPIGTPVIVLRAEEKP